MRYLHVVQAHERFVASGIYHFSKNGKPLEKSESWTLHKHSDGETFIRVDMDSRREDGKSILAEALLDRDDKLARFDIRYENPQFDGGIQRLAASYQFGEDGLQVGFALNGAARQYCEVELPAGTLIDIPLLIFRGRAILSMAEQGGRQRPIYVPMFEHAQLFPGALREVASPVDAAGEAEIALGQRAISTRRFRYRDRAAAYWIDRHGIVIKRVNAFRQNEIVVQISNYVPPAQ